MNTDSEKEKQDIEMLRKKYPDLDIVEVAYNKNGELVAFATKDIPPPILIDTSNWYGENYKGV